MIVLPATSHKRTEYLIICVAPNGGYEQLIETDLRRAIRWARSQRLRVKFGLLSLITITRHEPGKAFQEIWSFPPRKYDSRN